MNKTKKSNIVRTWLENEIKLINKTGITTKAKELIIEEKIKLAMANLAHIWIGDIKSK